MAGLERVNEAQGHHWHDQEAEKNRNAQCIDLILGLLPSDQHSIDFVLPLRHQCQDSDFQPPD